MKKSRLVSSIGDYTTHYVGFIYVYIYNSIGNFIRIPINRRGDIVQWFCTWPIADVPEECFGALVRGYNKKQKSPWGNLGSLGTVSLKILNFFFSKKSSLTNRTNQQKRTQGPCQSLLKSNQNTREPTQVIEKFPKKP